MMAIPLDGGPPLRICASYCLPAWSSSGRFLFIAVEAPTQTSPGRSLAIPVGPGESLPAFPPEGIEPGAEPDVIPGSQSVNRALLVPGEDLSHFAYVNTTSHRNLYRISLPLNREPGLCPELNTIGGRHELTFMRVLLVTLSTRHPTCSPSQKFVLYSPHRALPAAGHIRFRYSSRRKRESARCSSPGERATVIQHRGDVPPPVEHRVEEGVAIARPQIFFHASVETSRSEKRHQSQPAIAMSWPPARPRSVETPQRSAICGRTDQSSWRAAADATSLKRERKENTRLTKRA